MQWLVNLWTRENTQSFNIHFCFIHFLFYSFFVLLFYLFIRSFNNSLFQVFIFVKLIRVPDPVTVFSWRSSDPDSFFFLILIRNRVNSTRIHNHAVIPIIYQLFIFDIDGKKMWILLGRNKVGSAGSGSCFSWSLDPDPVRNRGII